MTDCMLGAVATASASDWVTDASATMPWLFPDQATPFTEGLLDALGDQTIWAPALWVLECANLLQSTQRRSRLNPQRRAAVAAELADLPVRIDQQAPGFVVIDRLTATHGLSIDDAA